MIWLLVLGLNLVSRPLVDVATYKAADPWMDRILNYENRLLEALCFDIAVSHPHEYLADAFGGGIRDASRWYWRGPLANKDMVDRGLYQLAWSVANDS